jgi:precorrin-2 dehydrogenase / sirohydrochlorin ferrochelatase
MKYYPISLNLSGRACVIVGGGEVAERKVKRLLDCGANVSVISETLTAGLEQLKEAGEIRHIASAYAEPVLDGAFLVFGTTDDADVNETVCRDARQRGILVNIADDPNRCDFILPSFFEQGDLQIAVSTGGNSPALARRVRMDVESLYGPEYEVYLAILGELRKAVISRGRPSAENKRLFEAVVNSDILDKIRRGERSQVECLIRDLTGVEMNLERLM